LRLYNVKTLQKRGLLLKILFLAWPAIVQEGLNVAVSYIDTAMVGTMGAEASAAVGLSSTLIWLVSSIAGGFGIGVLALAAQADGSGDASLVKKAGHQAFYITLAVGIPLTVICLAVSPFVPAWLGADISIRHDASVYFAIISSACLFRTALIIFSSALRGVSDMKTPMLINLVMNLVNVALNFFFIYPTRRVDWLFDLTLPGAGLGVAGAAIATAISLAVGGILMFIFYCVNKSFDVKNSGIHYDGAAMRSALKIGIPVVMSRSVLCFGYVAFSAIVTGLGVIPLAAHNIAIQAEQAFYIPGYGFQSAAATLAGNAKGEGDRNKIKRVNNTICAITFSVMFVAGIILFVFADALMGIFTPDVEVIKLGAAVLRIVSVSEPIYGVLVILDGTFNGLGDTKIPFVFSVITMWGIRILGSAVLVNVFGFGLQTVWILMIADNIARCVMLAVRFSLKYGKKAVIS